jgi:hypothetical protein
MHTVLARNAQPVLFKQGSIKLFLHHAEHHVVLLQAVKVP